MRTDELNNIISYNGMVIEVGHFYNFKYLSGQSLIFLTGKVEKIKIIDSRTNDGYITIDSSDEYKAVHHELFLRNIKSCEEVQPSEEDDILKEVKSVVSVDSSIYDTMKHKNDVVYFLEDTKEICKGDHNFSRSIIIVSKFPEQGIRNKLYINKNTLEMRFYNGKSWLTIVKSEEQTVDHINDLVEQTVSEVLNEENTFILDGGDGIN